MKKKELKKSLFDKRDKEIKEVKTNVSETIRKNNETVKNGTYCRALCSTLHDVNNLVPLVVKETNNYLNENYHAIEILKEIELDDETVIIFDRKYYSKELLKFLNGKNIIPIFRMDIDSNMIKDINEKELNEKTFMVENIEFKAGI